MGEKITPLGKVPAKTKSKDKETADLDYRVLFEQTGECVFIIGLDLKFTTANRQALRLVDYEEYQLRGMPVEEIVFLDEDDQRKLQLERYLNLSEHTIKKKDGSALSVEINISVVHNSLGSPTYIQMLVRDDAERRQSEINMKRHMRALSIIGEVTASLFRSTNIETKIPEVLESLGFAVDLFCCALLDINESSMNVQAQWVSFDSLGFDITNALVPFLNSIRENPTRVFSVTGVKIDAKRVEIPQISILVIPIQGTLGSWGYLALFDKQHQLSWLTTEFDSVQTTANLIGAALERVHYEKTIRLSEMRNRVIVDALPDLLLRTGLTGQILDYSVHPSHPLYLPQESVIGKNLSDLWPAEVVGMIVEPQNRKAFISPHWVHGFKLPNHDQVFEARLHPISSEEALIIVRDITEQARLDQMKSDFINRASHELRTPLTSAILMTELLQLGGTPEEMTEYLGTLMRELNRQKDLINQLLIAGRLESGKMKLEVVPMDLIPVLKEAIRALKAMAKTRNISILLETDLESINILGDSSGLSQVFINLINNAVKFSPEGQTVEVVAAKGINNEATISIIDHGLGIPPESVPHLYERFFRARNVTVAEIPGSGVGLYIVKSIVDEVGGKIEVKSELNEGTTFVVTLRLSR